MTPRGLKIRVEIPYAFGLMGRLAPARDAYRILKTTEGLEHIPSTLGLCAGLYVLLTTPAILPLIYAVVIGRILGKLLLWFGLFIVPGLIQLTTIVSFVSGYGLVLVPSGILCFLIIGWQGLLAFAGAWVVSMIIGGLIDWMLAWRRSKRLGQAISLSEINFFNAYRLHADSCGVTSDIVLPESEAQSGKWLECLEEYAKNYPKAVARFGESYAQAVASARRV